MAKDFIRALNQDTIALLLMLLLAQVNITDSWPYV